MSTRTAWLVACCCALSGCQQLGGASAPVPPEPASEPPPAAAVAPAAPKPPPTVKVTLLVATMETEAFLASWGDPARGVPPALPGVRACIREHPEVKCAVTGDDGVFTLEGVPAEQQLVLTLDKDGYVPMVLPLITDRFDHIPPPKDVHFVLQRPEQLSRMLPEGTGLDPTKGYVQVWVRRQGEAPTSWPGVSGATLELSAPGARGPFFVDARGRRAPGAKTSSGGLAYFVDLPSGAHVLYAGHPELECELGGAGANPPWLFFGHLTDEAKAEALSIGVPVLAGHLTSVGVFCR